MKDPLIELTELPEISKEGRGLQHTPGEIAQQPDTWWQTYEKLQGRRDEIVSFLQRRGVTPKHCDHAEILFVGAGSSDYVGRSLTSLFRKKWGCVALSVPSTDLVTDISDWVLPARDQLWISFSRSGESPEGVALLERALKQFPQISHIIVTCNEQGRMVKQFQEHPSVLVIALDDAVNDRGLAMTSSFTNMIVAGQYLAHIFDRDYSRIATAMVDAGRKILPVVAPLTSRLSHEPYTRVCFLGSGPLNGVAQESALKVVELTAGQINTMSQTHLGLRHGPMSAIDHETLLVSFLSSDPRRRPYEIDLLAEVAKKGLAMTRVAISLQTEARVKNIVQEAISLNGLDLITDEYRAPLDVLFGQLFGLFASIEKGLKPDDPSPNSTISRVVSPFEIYASEASV